MSLSVFRRGIALLCACAMLPALGGAEYKIRWDKQVEVSGIETATLRALKGTNWPAAQWRRLLSVQAEQGNVITDMNLPAIAGSHAVEGKKLIFKPQFPLQANVSYRAVFRPEMLPGGSGKIVTSQHRIAAVTPKSTTVVTAIRPTVAEIPENILKFYVHFSAPMSGARIYDHMELTDAKGKVVELPFLEIDEELWDRSMTRLTLFLDPGRIKRGVRPLEEIGPALVPGREFKLRISREWRDAKGAPLAGDFVKKFRVVEADRTSPNPANWKIKAPGRGSRQPLTVTFDESLDHAITQRTLRVSDPSGAQIAGFAKLDALDRTWTFLPAQRWKKGQHHLLVPTIIEDLAGNNIDKPFDVDLTERPQAVTNSIVRIGFFAK